MTKPGVQKPHWEPWLATMACWMGCNAPSHFRLSTVNSARPSSMGANRMQALTALNSTFPSRSSPSTTVQAPQSPSAQPSFVPVRRR